MRGLRDCDPVTVYTANLDPDRFSIRIAIHLSIWIESIAIRIGRSNGKNYQDRDPDIFVPCKRGIRWIQSWIDPDLL